MRKPLLLIMTALFAVLAAAAGGCRAFDVKSPSESNCADTEKAETANRPGSIMLTAFIADDADSFITILPDAMRKEFSAKDFASHRAVMEKELGKPISFRYMGSLKHPLLDVELFAVLFERQSAISADNRVILQEALFRTVSGKLNGKDSLLSFHFL